ncbi:PLP-dependent transferase [Mycena chlorophos]|uniref:PLP-dependent transferase n=1 Tax=Mycena chlorophos TaxID=658473 RepID=A0A8H6SP97_MYCCL|nr:PLP-dependent transferase [Mycena chlorophos]
MSWKSFETKKPPVFGHPMIEHFPFDPTYTNLKHGSYGFLPRRVLEYCKAPDAEAESNPDKRIWQTYLPLLTNVRTRLTSLIGAKPDECVMVANASTGVSTVLRNIVWKTGDIIVAFSTTYYTVLSTAQSISDFAPNPTMSKIALKLPTTRAAVLSQFRTHLQSLPQKPGQQAVAIIDGMTFRPRPPLAPMARARRQLQGEANLRLNEVDPDFWVALRPQTQPTPHRVQLPQDPTSGAYLSPGNGNSTTFVQQFDFTASIDFVPFLSVAAALDFRTWLGGEDKINAYCRDLAKRGVATTQAKIYKRMFSPESGTFTMVWYIADHDTSGWWTRASAQIWNDISDSEKLGEVLLRVCAEVKMELEAEKAKL